jgi:maltose O-acetyltransferase
MSKKNPKAIARMLVTSSLDSHEIRSGVANRLGGILPTFTSGAIRSRIYRVLGFDVHPGAFIEAPLTIISGQRHSKDRLHIGPRTRFGVGIIMNVDDHITIKEGATIGPFCLLYTTSHTIGPSSFRCGEELTTAPIVIEEGAWIALKCTILPGVTIGRGAVVATGSVVTSDVAPNTLVGGVPAKFIKNLDVS